LGCSESGDTQENKTKQKETFSAAKASVREY